MSRIGNELIVSKNHDLIYGTEHLPEVWEMQISACPQGGASCCQSPWKKFSAVCQIVSSLFSTVGREGHEVMGSRPRVVHISRILLFWLLDQWPCCACGLSPTVRTIVLNSPCTFVRCLLKRRGWCPASPEQKNHHICTGSKWSLWRLPWRRQIWEHWGGQHCRQLLVGLGSTPVPRI